MKPVFLVDDSPTMLASVSAVLGRSGVAVQTAANGEDALRIPGAKPPLRIIIIDVHMPGMNGVDLIREIRKIAMYRFLPNRWLWTSWFSF